MTKQYMAHDPLCEACTEPAADCCEYGCIRCQCDLIAKVRSETVEDQKLKNNHVEWCRDLYCGGCVEVSEEPRKPHDVLCNIYEKTCCPWMGDCQCQCNCDFILEIRKNERETCIEIVNSHRSKFKALDWNDALDEAVSSLEKALTTSHDPLCSWYDSRGCFDDDYDCWECTLISRVRAEYETPHGASAWHMGYQKAREELMDFSGSEEGLYHHETCEWYGKDSQYMVWSEKNYAAGWLICPCEKLLSKDDNGS